MAALSIADIDARTGECRDRIKALDAAASGERFSDEQRDEWNALNEEIRELGEQRSELVARQEQIAKLFGEEQGESERRTNPRVATRKSLPDDLTAAEEYRNLNGTFEQLQTAYRDGARKLVERMSPASEFGDEDATKDRLERLLTGVDQANEGAEQGALARRIIGTSSDTYMRAFGKYVAGRRDSWTPEEQRAMSLSSSAGGYAVPVTLDPTVILYGGGYVNPIRQVADVRTITGNTWQGVNTGGITAGYGAEATEASDNAPTLGQPSANVEKAFAFVPMSIEISQDWGAIQSEMAELFADAKTTLETTQFLTGLGHGSNAPQGLIAVGGYTAVVSTATTAVIAVADIYSLEAALHVRARNAPRACFFGSKAFYQKVRQLDTSGGANLWVQLQNANPAQLIGYNAYEWSAYSSAVTTSGSTVASFGDPSRFLIVDRVGMDVELIPHLFATANNRPSGQRGLYAYWRNTTAIKNPSLGANSAFYSLKVL
jgi:HK97 family phage major capsid protein